MNYNNEKEDIMWINPITKKLIIIIPMIFTIMFFVPMFFYLVYSFMTHNFSGDDMYNLDFFGKTILLIIQIAFAIPLFISWYFYYLTRNPKIKIGNHPFLKKIYSINLITYSNKLNFTPLSVEKSFYYRELPCGNNLLLVYWISFQYHLSNLNEDFMGAVILKLIINNSNCYISSNEGSYLNIALIKNCEYEYEHMLVDILKEISNNGILKKEDFKKWYTNNYRKITKWFDYCLQIEEQQLIKEEKIHYDYDKKEIIATNSITEMAKNIIGLKQYLINFSTIKEKKIVEVHLWEYYLIYAKILGIAKKVKTEFKDIYPDLIELFDDLYVNLKTSEDLNIYIE